MFSYLDIFLECSLCAFGNIWNITPTKFNELENWVKLTPYQQATHLIHGQSDYGSQVEQLREMLLLSYCCVHFLCVWVCLLTSVNCCCKGKRGQIASCWGVLYTSDNWTVNALLPQDFLKLTSSLMLADIITAAFISVEHWWTCCSLHELEHRV